MLNSV